MAVAFSRRLLLGAYSGLWTVAKPFLKRHKRLREGFDERLLSRDWPVADSEFRGSQAIRIWIQAASGGEAWLVHALAPALAAGLRAHPALASRPLRLLCTSCTRQGLDVLEKLELPAPARVLPRFFPLDHPITMQRAVRQADPHLLLLLETELWPGLLAAARERGVPVLLANGRMTGKSFAGYRLLRPLWQQLAPDRVLAVSGADAGRFAELFASRTQVGTMSNIKFDRMAAELADKAGPDLRGATGLPQDCLLAVLASVREEEEDQLVAVIASLREACVSGRPIAVAVAPRHMHRVGAWRDKLLAAGVPFRLRSAASSADKEAVILWDSFGELNALYAMADAVFVGGSLAPLGGQNFLEPAAQGLAPLVGPHTENFHWIGEDFFKRGLARRVQKDGLAEVFQASLASRLRALQSHAAGEAGEPDWRAARLAEAQQARARFADWLEPHTGGCRKAAAEAVEMLLALFSRSG